MNIDKLMSLDAQDILKISLLKPENLFLEATSEKEVKQAYIKLSFKWHPDRNPNNILSDNVFAHINLLYKKSKEKFKNNTWAKGFIKEFSKSSGIYRYPYLFEGEFELGQYLIAKDSIAWIFESDNQDLAENAIKKIESIKYANLNMKQEMGKFMPVVEDYFVATDSSVVMIIKRDPEGIILSDILRHSKKVEAKHVAWILSNCYHIACFMQYNRLMHGGLSLEHISVNPQTHSAQLLGGWWFTQELNQKLHALSSRTLDIAPFEVINSKKALGVLDLDCIRFMGRELLGDKNGLHLVANKDIPSSLTHWLRGASHNNAFEEYQLWHNVLKNSFGVRRFIKMELTSNDIYI